MPSVTSVTAYMATGGTPVGTPSAGQQFYATAEVSLGTTLSPVGIRVMIQKAYGRDIFGTLYTFDRWWCTGIGSHILGTPATAGEASITLTPDGADMDVDIACPVGTYSGTLSGAGDWDWNTVGHTMSTGSWSSTTENYVDYTIVDRGITERWDWSSEGELDDWTVAYGEVRVIGGHLLGPEGSGQGTIITPFERYLPPRGLTALLSPPSIQRIVASEGTGQLHDRYASGALADILTGSLVDDHPELLHLGAGAHHLGIVWQRGDDIAMTTGTGVPGIGGWPQTVQTVALDRSHPTACVIDPTLDAYMAYLQSGSIALGCPASWSNGSFSLGTETIISSGDVATERGQLLWTPQAKLLYVYRDTSGAVVIKESGDRGKSWS